MGKTSLLYEFRQIALRELQRHAKCASVYFSLSPDFCKDWNSFCAGLLQSARSDVIVTQTISSRFAKEMRNWSVSLGIGPMNIQRTSRTEESPAEILQSLQDLWNKVLAPSGVEIAFILLDDLHYFRTTKKESSYLNLRTTFQELVNRKCNYSLVVTADAALFNEIADLAEPLTRFFKRFTLSAFTLGEAREATEKRLKAIGRKTSIDDDVIEQIVKRTEGHPYLFMFSMFEMLTGLGSVARVTEAQFEGIWPAIESALGDAVFSEKYNSATQAERQLMISIANSGADVVSASELRIKGANTLLSRLQEKELLVKRDRGKYSLFHPLFAAYLRRL